MKRRRPERVSSPLTPPQSLYPPLSLPGTSEFPSHPYFHTPPEQRDRASELVNGSIPYEQRYSDQDSDEEDQDDEEPLEGIPHNALIEAGASVTAEASVICGNESDHGDEAAVDTSRSREFGRSRGRIHARGFGLGSGSRGGSTRERGGPRGRPRGSKGVPRGEGQRGGGKGSKRGPQRPVEPSDEFKKLQGKATNAFLAKAYDEALEHARKAIQINPEVFAAHSLLSEIYREMGKKEDSLAVLWSGAHTQRDAAVWWEIANRTAELSTMDEESLDKQLLYCYSRILKHDKNDVEARKAKLNIHIKGDFPLLGTAMRECTGLMKRRPHDLALLQTYAEISMEAGEPLKAKEAYDRTVDHLLEKHPDAQGIEFSFSDLNIYLEIFAHMKQFASGLVRLKEVARWLCGRCPESHWNSFHRDDREWDIEDEPRRVEITAFQPGVYHRSSYGESLPLEIRAKLGLFRLKINPLDISEAIHHFEFLEPDDRSQQAPVIDYPDVFRDVADSLYTYGYYDHALRFYEPLSKTQKELEETVRVNMAKSYLGVSKHDLAISTYEYLARAQPRTTDHLLQLAKIHDSIGEYTKAQEYATRLTRLGKADIVRRANLKAQVMHAHQNERPKLAPAKESPKTTPVSKPQKRAAASTLRLYETIADRYRCMMNLQTLVNDGDVEAEVEWMQVAASLIADFQKVRYFFPGPKHLYLSLGESVVEARRMVSDIPNTNQNASIDVADIRKGHQDSLGELDSTTMASEEFCGISFAEWLEIFCKYAFIAARRGVVSEAYGTLEAATKANVFYHDESHMFHIHICWFTCALILSDEATLSTVARWFMKTYAGATDCYRLFAALHRLLDVESTQFQSGPHQKYLMRQIRMLDYTLLDEDGRKRFDFDTKDRVAAANMFGAQSSLKTHDPALLTLYGHMLASHGRYANALNYYLRALATDPRNPLVFFSIALAYLQEAMKRTRDKKNDYFVRGIAFFNEYKKARVEAVASSENTKLGRNSVTVIRGNRKMEVEFNEGRMWHLLGLTSLAIPAYERCLATEEYGDWNATIFAGIDADENEVHMALQDRSNDKEEVSDGDNQIEDGVVYEPGFKKEAALALQQIYAVSGHLIRAREITERWLVF